MVTSIPTQSIPEHIFISFSQKDRKTAEEIVHTLCHEGIPVWIDYAKLVPGTPDWESAIREAINKSFAIVVLASPNSRDSKYVKGELHVAESKGRQIYPVWIEGTDWSDCIPLSMTYAQYIDARQTCRDKGMVELCQVLREYIQTATPKHYLVQPIRRMVGRSLTHVSPPPGFVSVQLTDEAHSWEEGGAAVFLRIAEYSCVQAFLDDLYINYLKDRFKPYTYGESWILLEDAIYGLLLVPWAWLFRSSTEQESNRDWFLQKSPAECGINPGTHWSLQYPSKVEAIGLAVNDDRIYRAMRRSAKAEYFLRDLGVIADKSTEAIGSNYKYRYVIPSSWRLFGDEVEPSKSIVQTEVPVPENEINYWLS